MPTKHGKGKWNYGISGILWRSQRLEVSLWRRRTVSHLAVFAESTDPGFRPRSGIPELAFELLAVLPGDYHLTAQKAISPPDLVGETFASVSNRAPVLRVVIDDYLKQSGVDITPNYEVDRLAMAISLIASTRDVSFLPAYAENFLPGDKPLFVSTLRFCSSSCS